MLTVVLTVIGVVALSYAAMRFGVWLLQRGSMNRD